MELLARTCNTEVMNVQRIAARAFVIVGALFWVFMIWGAKWAYEGAPFTEAAGSAALVAIAIAVLFIVGLFYEYLAALLLSVAALGVVVFGVIQAWEAGVWGTVLIFFIAPMIVAAVLYVLAARMQRICAL